MKTIETTYVCDNQGNEVALIIDKNALQDVVHALKEVAHCYEAAKIASVEHVLSHHSIDSAYDKKNADKH